MKNISLILLFFLAISCKKNNINDIDTIDKFIRIYYVKQVKDINLEKIFGIEFNSKLYNNLSEKQKENINNYFKFLFNSAHLELKQNNYQYQIYNSSDIDKNLLNNYKIRYPKTDSIYYVVSNSKIFSFFIIENNKIISFCSQDFISQGKSIEPLFLNSENQIKKLF